MSDYPAFGKIPRFHRDVVITEKIDGTNGLVSIEDVTAISHLGARSTQDLVERIGDTTYIEGTETVLAIKAGSRNRWLSPGKEDNYGFAAWVHSNAEELVQLGPGNHYGEWWGQGIGRKYGLDHKRFSLFNSGRWYDAMENDEAPDFCPKAVPAPEICHVVPVLGGSDGSEIGAAVGGTISLLRNFGSLAAEGFMKPEGIIIFHTASRQSYKVTLEKDEAPKGSNG